MTTNLLVIVPLLQATVILLLLVLMISLRIARMKLSRRVAQQQDEGFAIVRAWLSGRQSDADALARLNACSEDAVAGVAKKASANFGRIEWEAVIGLLRRTRWFAAMRLNVRSRWWWRRLDAARCLYGLARPVDAEDARRLVEDHNATVRIVAARIVRRVASHDLILAVLRQALRSEAVLQSYLLGLLRPHGLAVVEPLIELGRGAASEYELKSIIKFMAEIQDPRFREPITARAEDERPEIRTAVAAALGHFPHHQTTAKLSKLVEDENWRVRAAAADSLGCVVAVESVELLRKRLHDEEFAVRLKAAAALCQLGSKGLQCLLETIRRDRADDAELARYVLRFQNRARIEHVQEMLEG